MTVPSMTGVKNGRCFVSEDGLCHGDRQIDSQPARQTDRQTDLMELVAAFHTSANAPKNLL